MISLRCKRTTTLPMEEAEEAERENEHSLNGERSLNGECRCCVDYPVNMHFPVPKPALFLLDLFSYSTCLSFNTTGCYTF